MVDIGHKIWEIVDRIIHVILEKIYDFMGKDLSDETYESFLQFIKFGIVGLSNTAISYMIYVISLLLLKNLHIFSSVDYVLSSVIAFILSVLWSFYWNNKMVFKLNDGEKRSVWKALLKTYVSYSFTGLFLNNILLILWVRVFRISEFIAPVVNLIISVPLNFIINKFWAFKKA